MSRVYYRTDRPIRVTVGQPAIVCPVGHPSDLVTGDGKTPAITSPVVRFDERTGEFWTQNTHYVPQFRAEWRE
jgi:hypothetical protein